MGAMLEREVDTMVLNDGILPTQLDANAPLCPERKLWLAVLEKVQDDLRLRGTIATKRYKESVNATLDWLYDDTEVEGSFRWICHALGLDPGCTARAMRGPS